MKKFKSMDHHCQEIQMDKYNVQPVHFCNRKIMHFVNYVEDHFHEILYIILYFIVIFYLYVVVVDKKVIVLHYGKNFDLLDKMIQYLYKKMEKYTHPFQFINYSIDSISNKNYILWINRNHSNALCLKIIKLLTRFLLIRKITKMKNKNYKFYNRMSQKSQIYMT